jgi:hypothetical protein
MVRIFLRQVNEAGNDNFGMGFLKEPLLQAQLTSGLVNSEDFSKPGKQGGNYNFGMGFFERTFTTGSTNLWLGEW